MLTKNLKLLHNKIIHRSILVSLLIILSLNFMPQSKAFSAVSTSRVLVIYSTESGTMNESVRLLDLLLGQFTGQITFKADEAVTSGDLQEVTHLVYYGNTAKKLPSAVAPLIGEFKGSVLAIGENADQLGARFSFMKTRPDTVINKISKTDPSTHEPVYQLLDVNYAITHVELLRGETILQGWKGDIPFPLFVQYENSAYLASSDLYVPFNRFLSEGLAAFLGKPLLSERMAYIRLEDIHPMSDPKLLKQTGDYLADKGIPFMIAVIPVYTNSETNQQIHLAESPQLVEVLRYLQGRGASILLHGYTHQYRSSETGEGFEFWDVKNNTPIWGPADHETTVKKRYEFSSKADYDHYMDGLNAFESAYVETRVQSGIRELTELGLYPLAFEAPHYVMSQNGYEVVSRYFNYLLGQTQISDSDWQHMGVSAFMSKPSFLHGMALLPETIGFYDHTSLTPEADIDQKINDMEFVEGGMMGMFYHPYLGLEKLKTFISHLERVPNVSWLDLRKMNISVHAPNLTISTDAQGKIHYDNTSPPVETPHIVQGIKRLGSLQLILWGMAILVAMMVLMFFLYTLSMRMNLRKQLFEERNISG
ncbi:DUF2334 domain-containing protein [Paenibacillus sp. SI8]|uniref:DUF2334 domain-containing protein n=1 Tax=unclassified Paenibacillus TaxID=185978 RepID=UPI0034661512